MTSRFGIQPLIQFDPFMKLNLSLVDVLSLPKDNNANQYCNTTSLVSSRDVFVRNSLLWLHSGYPQK